MLNHLEFPAGQFIIHGDLAEIYPCGNGHINDTYRVIFNQAGTEVSYIFQRINHHVFKKPEELMDNVVRVTEHIRARLEKEEIPETSQRVLTIVPARDLSSYYKDDKGNYWRVYLFVHGAQAHDAVQSKHQAFEAARAFGQFQEMLTDLPAPPLHETIPGFHDGPRRFRRFQEILEADSHNRAGEAKPEIRFLLEHASLFDVLPDLVKDGKIPVRNCHNDTKINNVLLDERSGEGLCVIDLDTVMPGLTAFDFGDRARTTLSTVPEDEPDLFKVEVDMEMFRTILRGYLSSAGKFLTGTEVEHLITGAKMMTQIIGMRFLIDFLEGDRYFKIQREGQNLARCRTQFKLVQSIIEHEEEMAAILEQEKKTPTLS